MTLSLCGVATVVGAAVILVGEKELLSPDLRVWSVFPYLDPASDRFLSAPPAALLLIGASAAGPLLTAFSLLAARRIEGAVIFRWLALTLLILACATAWYTAISLGMIDRLSVAARQKFFAHWFEGAALFICAIWAFTASLAIANRRVRAFVQLLPAACLFVAGLFFGGLGAAAAQMGMPTRYIDCPAQYEGAMFATSVSGFAFAGLMVVIIAFKVIRRLRPPTQSAVSDVF
jgi:hypothetical protein